MSVILGSPRFELLFLMISVVDNVIVRQFLILGAVLDISVLCSSSSNLCLELEVFVTFG